MTAEQRKHPHAAANEKPPFRKRGVGGIAPRLATTNPIPRNQVKRGRDCIVPPPRFRSGLRHRRPPDAAPAYLRFSSPGSVFLK